MKNKKDRKMIHKIYKETLKESLEVYGDKLESIILYGSYARGDYNEDSDIDIALIIDLSIEELSLIYGKLLDKTIHIGEEENKFVSIVDISKQKFEDYKECLPYYSNIDLEGIKLFTKEERK